MIVDNEELHNLLAVISFSEAVEYKLREKKFENYITAAAELASELDLADKDVVKLISPALRDKIRIEGEENGLLYRDSKPMMTF